MTPAQKKKNTRQNLLESAAVLFTEKGYNNTSVAEICELAKANIASVNYHFRSKEELYREVLTYTHEQAEVLYPMASNDEKNVEEKLYRFILAFLKRIISTEMNGNFYQLVAKEMAEPIEASGTLINEIVAKKRETILQLIKELYGKPAEPQLFSQMTHSIVSQCLFLGLHQKGRQHHLKRKPLDLSDAESFAKHITKFCLAGIKHYPS
ncbi:MAG: CerR family C-terminal domain-containing protein [Proteobacteria bacterium]|nr:CerR family C-terminal domain-containing protein [Pseudomonadota bacterium]MBU1716647.1 CerR family C-terminal domain-containing protein [Pseudomonadota bacterium]